MDRKRIGMIRFIFVILLLAYKAYTQTRVSERSKNFDAKLQTNQGNAIFLTDISLAHL